MDTKKHRILLVEDDDALRTIHKDSFERAGFEVLATRNGQEGLDTALREHPDLVLMDIMMPIMDGLTALKKLREDEWGAKVPVFILTNSFDVGTMAETMQSHILQYMIKAEVDMEKVVEEVKATLSSPSPVAKAHKGSFSAAPSDETQRVEYSA